MKQSNVGRKTINKWLEVLKFGTFAERELINFRKTSKYSVELRNAFYHNMPDGGYHISNDHQAKGTKYLLSKSLRKDGKKRKGNRLGELELSILQDSTVRHRLVDMHVMNSYVPYWLPVYRAQDYSGRYFEYTGTIYDQIEILGAGNKKYPKLKAV